MEIKDEALPIGTILQERYRIERKIGTGGMSRVYLSSDQWRKNSYAVIKTPLAKLLKDKWVIKKFKQEAESLARLKHTGIVKLLGHGYYENILPFVILEYVDGVTLSTLMDELLGNPKRAVTIFLQIVEAIEHAHNREIFHRDLKPDNIMVQQSGTPNESIKLIDFGIARIDDSFFRTSPNTRYKVGTPHYISPNRIRDDPHDRADDIYALGLIAYEMMTGENPLKEASDFAELKKLHKIIPPPRQMNSALSEMVNKEIVKALSLHQSNRHSSALEFGKLLYSAFSPNETSETTSMKPSLSEEPIPTTKDYSYLEPTFNQEEFLNSISPGERYLLEGDFDKAIDFYTEQISNYKRSDLYFSRRAMAYLLKNNYEKATQDCQEALRIYSKNDFAQLIKGIIYRLKLWSDEAETILVKAINNNQDNIEAALVLGDIEASRGNINKALQYYQHICRVNPAFSWVYTNLGNLYYNERNYEIAIENFTIAIKTKSDNPLNYFQRAKSLIKSGQSEIAVEDLTKAIELDPQNTKYYNERAKVFFSIGRNKDAIADFNQVTNICEQATSDSNNRVTKVKNKNAGLASLVEYLRWFLSEEFCS